MSFTHFQSGHFNDTCFITSGGTYKLYPGGLVQSSLSMYVDHMWIQFAMRCVLGKKGLAWRSIRRPILCVITYLYIVSRGCLQTKLNLDFQLLFFIYLYILIFINIYNCEFCSRRWLSSLPVSAHV